MKKLFLYLSVISLCITLNAQNTASTKPAQNSKKELAKLIRTHVVLKDTTAINNRTNTNSVTESNIVFLDSIHFSEFKKNILKIGNSKESLVFLNIRLEDRLTSNMINKRLFTYDTLVSNYGNKELQKITTIEHSLVEIISEIDFYETWYIDEKSKMIEKEVLAYEIYIDSADPITEKKIGTKPLFTVVKDEETRKKLSLLIRN